MSVRVSKVGLLVQRRWYVCCPLCSGDEVSADVRWQCTNDVVKAVWVTNWVWKPMKSVHCSHRLCFHSIFFDLWSFFHRTPLLLTALFWHTSQPISIWKMLTSSAYSNARLGFWRTAQECVWVGWKCLYTQLCNFKSHLKVWDQF